MSNGEPARFNEEYPKAAFRLEESAFEAFFREHFATCCSYCRTRFGFDNELAKEVVHTAFVKLWENRFSLSGTATLRSYLFRIVINTSLDVIKQEKNRQRYSRFFLETTAEGFEETEMNRTDYKQLAADIKNAIAQLPEQMRTIFELSRNEGLKYSDIAQQLNLSVKTVETQMSRALVKLREKLGHYLLLLLATVVLIKIF